MDARASPTYSTSSTSSSSTSRSRGSMLRNLLSGPCTPVTPSFPRPPTLQELNVDVIGNIMAFLTPSARYAFLAYPPNRNFKSSYSDSAYLWLKLCHMPPHRANPKVLPCALAGNSDMAKMR